MGVSLGGLPPVVARIPCGTGRWWGDASLRPGPCARGRRLMGSVGGWPLAIPITVASGGNREGGSRNGSLPNRSSTRGESRSHPVASTRAAVGVCAGSLLGNLEGESRSP